MDPTAREGTADFVKAKFSPSRRPSDHADGKAASSKVPSPSWLTWSKRSGGIIAARHSLLRRLKFENDYGVDVGLLLDVAGLGARIAEVDIGIWNTTASRCKRWARDGVAGRPHPSSIGPSAMAACGAARCERAGESRPTPETAIAPADRLALFDMDGTLLQGRFAKKLAQRVNRSDELERYLDCADLPDEERTRAIADLFRGTPRQAFEEKLRAEWP